MEVARAEGRFDDAQREIARAQELEGDVVSYENSPLEIGFQARVAVDLGNG